MNEGADEERLPDVDVQSNAGIQHGTWPATRIGGLFFLFSREKNLPLVIDNPRFLILPWIEIPNLGSHILAIVRWRLGHR